MSGSAYRLKSLFPSQTTGSYLRVGDAFLHRDQRVIGDLDVLGADLGTALGDVAQAKPETLPGPCPCGPRRPVDACRAPQCACGKRGPAKFSLFSSWSRTTWQTFWHRKHSMHLRNSWLRSTSFLLHAVLARLQLLRRGERRDLARLLIVEGHVGHQVAHHGERPQRRDGDGLVLAERRHPGHAHQPRLAVDLGRARAALACLAVPPHGEVVGLGGLQAMDDVEHHLAVVDLGRCSPSARRRPSSPRQTRMFAS